MTGALGMDLTGLLARSTASGWVLCCLALAGLIQITRVIAMQRPKMKELELAGNKDDSSERAADFDRLRREIDGQNQRIEKLEGQVEAARKIAADAGEHAARSDAKLQSALTACEVLLSLVEREMPGSTEIGLVKRLLAQAASSDLGVGDGIRRLATVRGAGK